MGSFSKRYFGLIFALLFAAFYLHGMQGKRESLAEVRGRLEALEEERRKILAVQEELRLTINSQEDPNWIEMVLMRDLGVVPEGWIKVHFSK